MSFLDAVQPIATRGVVAIDSNCNLCEKPVAVMGMPGKGRPISTFAPDYFCQGHAVLTMDEFRTL